MAYLGNTIVNGVLRAINGISGNGSGITDINASNISTGTLNAERLPESYLPLTGGTLNGGLTWLGGSSGTALCGFKFGTGAAAANYYQPNFTSMDFGWNWDTGAGSGMAFRGTSYGGSQAGAFIFFARNSTSNYKQLEGYVDGTLKWTGSLFTVGGGTGTITGNITGNVLTGYTKPTTTSAIAATDTLNGAIGKLEKALDSKQTSINSSRSIEFITGTQTAATGAFKGITEDTSLYDGKCINYYLPYAGSGNATLELTFPDGSTSGAKSIFIVNSTRLTTHYSAGTIFQMTYSATKDAWYCGNYWYDSNTQGQYMQYYNTAYFRGAVATETIAVGDSTGYIQAAEGVTFDISYPILWITTNIAAGGSNYANCFIQHYDRSLANVKSSFTSSKWKMIYLVVTISGMTATVDSEIITDTLPSTENGKVYIAIGRLGNQTNGKNYFLFQAMHPMYHYKNGTVRIYDPTTAETGSSNGTIKINGTDVAVKGLGTAAYTASTAYAAANHTHSYAASSHSHSEIVTVGDKRSVATTPNDYTNKIIFQGLKTSSVIGSPTGSTYQYLVGLRGWSDSSGGKSHELAFSDNGISYRMGATTTWDAWQSILTSTSTLNAAKLSGTIPASCYTNTTYTGANGISLSGTTFSNSGVRSIATGSANGTISVNTNGTAADVAVKGLGTAAYTASTAYAAASHNHDGRYIYWGGTASNGTAWSWGTLTVANGYTQHSHLTGDSGCEGGFASKGGQLNMQLDGYFYQREGAYRCLDTADSSSFAAASHTHNYAGSSSAGGAATSALKVQNNPAAGSTADLVYSQMGSNDYFRIQTGGAANAGYVELATADDASEPIYVRQYSGAFASLVRTATLLDGSGNTSFPGSLTANTITASSLTGNLNGDNYVQWGGPSTAGSVSPTDAGCIDDFGHNKAAFWNGLIDVEYTTNGGNSWIDYGLTDDQKWALVTIGGYGVVVGKGTAVANNGGSLTNSNVTNYRARITLHTRDANKNGRFYTAMRKLLLNVSTSGAGGSTVKVTGRTIGNYNNNADTWNDLGSFSVSGWSGWNSIPMSITLGGGSTQTGQYADIRLEFWSTSVNTSYASTLAVLDIRIIGVTNWTVDSFAATGHMYTYDRSKNVTFPAKVTATSFSGALTGNVTGNCSGTAANVTGTVAIANGGTGATSRLNACKALFNENVSTSATYFYTGTDNWGKAGYSSKDEVKTILGLGTAAYTASTAYAAASHTHSYLPLSGGTLTGALTFANGTWNTVGDDAQIGDFNVAGTLGVRGANGTTAIALVTKGSTTDYAKISYDGTNITLSKPLSGYSTTSHTHNYAGSSSAGGAATSALVLAANPSGRPASANTTYANSTVHFYLASSSMTTGKPPTDATLIHMAWDNSKYDGQIAVSTSGDKLYYRSQGGSDTWEAWKTALATDEITTGTANGTISVAGTNIAVKGLGTAAYTASTAYATSGHTHTSITISSGLSWPGGANMSCTSTANGQEWSVDMVNTTYTGTYWHVWSGKNSKSCIQCYNDNCNVTVPNGTFTASKDIVMNGTSGTNYIQLPSGIKLY